MALYSDRHSIFSVNTKGKEHQQTQFRRATQTLGINTILAKSPQTKGRVERANQTLQDRLVKALRLANISNIEQANAFLPQFIEHFSQRFSLCCEASPVATMGGKTSNICIKEDILALGSRAKMLYSAMVEVSAKILTFFLRF